MDPEHQVDHLLLLVGGNALPNAVAGFLLAAPKATITLVFTKLTSDVAGQLKLWLEAKRPDLTAVKRIPEEVQESEPSSIWRGVIEALNTVQGKRVGLNYTGGTKAMSVHAYTAATRWVTEHKTSCQFSYLDARTLRMRIDPPNPATGARGYDEYVALGLRPEFQDLLRLHGWATEFDPATTPALPRSADALAKANGSNAAVAKWMSWKKNELEPKCWDKDQKNWKTPEALRSVVLRFPTVPQLFAFSAALRQELKQSGSVFELGRAADESGLPDADELRLWFDGKWLENYTQKVLKELQVPHELHDCLRNIKTPQPTDFEVDVVAIRGYQLFAFSCGADHKRQRLKLKLFEAYVRARQMGGDEARVALVCCSNKPKDVEQDMRRDLNVEGQIKVFGRQHLPDLKRWVGEWIKEQSRR